MFDIILLTTQTKYMFIRVSITIQYHLHVKSSYYHLLQSLSYIHNINLLNLPSRQTSARHRQSPIPLPSLSQTSQVTLVSLFSFVHFNLGNTCLNRHRPQELSVEYGVVKPYTDGRWSTGQSKINHKRSFLGGSTKQSSYPGNIVQELRDSIVPLHTTW